MLRLTLAGAHTLLTSTLCARCPQGPAGCCASPPAVAFADIGRIVRLGGRDFLLSELAAGRLRPIARGLAILRAPPAGDLPARCVDHGPAGCSIPHDRRSATCNYYICDDAFAFGGEAEAEKDRRGALAKARRVHDRLTALYGQWDIAIGERVRSRYPGGPPWDAVFLDWLGGEFDRVTANEKLP
jgi:hypothetical protein